MTLTLELSPEIEAQLLSKARQRGLALPDYLRQLAERDVQDDAQALMNEEAEREDAWRAGAEIMAPIYAESLASGGELTAFSAVQEDVHEYSDEELQSMRGIA
jgi:hypothetical protein